MVKGVNKLKLLLIIEAIIIILLLAVIITDYLSEQKSYCGTHYSDAEKCLLSPRIYTGIIQPESYLIINFEPLRADIKQYISSNNLNASVYITNLRDGATMGISENIAYDAVSLNKLIIAIAILKKIEAGQLKLDTLLPILEEDRDDESGILYNKNINELSVRELLGYMLQYSDNTALYALARQINLEEGKEVAGYLDYYKNNILNATETPEEYKVSAKTAGNLFMSLYLSTAMKPEDSEMILQLLTNTVYDIKKYANLPTEVVISQKYGSYHDDKINLFHSCGIIYINESRISYCVMTKDLNEEKGMETVGIIVNKIYEYILKNNHQ